MDVIDLEEYRKAKNEATDDTARKAVDESIEEMLRAQCAQSLREFADMIGTDAPRADE